MIRNNESNTSTLYTQQEQSEAPQLAKIINLTTAAQTPASKSETGNTNVPALIQADANSNYQPQQQSSATPNQATVSVAVAAAAVSHQILHPSINHALPAQTHTGHQNTEVILANII